MVMGISYLVKQKKKNRGTSQQLRQNLDSYLVESYLFM